VYKHLLGETYQKYKAVAIKLCCCYGGVHIFWWWGATPYSGEGTVLGQYWRGERLSHLEEM